MTFPGATIPRVEPVETSAAHLGEVLRTGVSSLSYPELFSTDRRWVSTDVMKSRYIQSHILETRTGLSWREVTICLAFIIILAYLFGTFDRFPFDDEIVTLVFIEHFTPLELLATRLGLYDIHPPVSYLLFQSLYYLGLPLWAMRFTSLLMSASAFLLLLDLTLAGIRPEGRMLRLVTALTFLTFPLLYGVGDSLRWYPPFALLVAGFFWLDLRCRRPTIAGGALLGLSASTNFLAVIPYVAFIARRYLFQRSFNLRIDGPFHLVMVIFAAPGLATFILALLAASHRARSVIHLEFSWSLHASALAVAQMVLGFFGGYRIGPVEIFLGLPFIALIVLALGSLALHRRGSEKGNRCDEMTTDLWVITAVMTVLCIVYSVSTVFKEGRALLFLAPFILSCFALGYWRRFSAAGWLPVCLASLLLFGTALANARESDAPFKRDLVIPFDEVRNFIAENVHGSVLYVTHEPVSRYLMRGDGYCVMFNPLQRSWLDVEPDLMPCARHGLDQFETIVVGIWPPNGPPWTPTGAAALDYIHEHRKLHSRAQFGYDRWAGLKTRLTGVALDPWAFTIEIYN